MFVSVQKDWAGKQQKWKKVESWEKCKSAKNRENGVF